MKKTLIITALAALFFASCDKIEEDQYLIYAGSTATWQDGSHIATPVNSVFLEKYTGMRCTNCPQADTVIAALQATYGNSLVVVAVHATSFARPYTGSEDLRTEVGDAWVSHFGITSLPKILINRNSGQLSADAAATAIEAELAQQQTVAMELNTSYNASTRKVEITPNIEFLQDVEGQLALTLIVTEDSIVGEQLSGTTHIENYVYNHVLRTAITDLWGTDIEAEGRAGECRKGTFKYTLPEAWDNGKEVAPAKCHIVAIVSDKESKRILQCAQSRLVQ
ncbi:MAG: Omp28 family outer membrane lipoprotein [Bacteroidales bacterium]|nr:Omp28 family outer membrane lipoprotein [Bacteroidales bacterium]